MSNIVIRTIWGTLFITLVIGSFLLGAIPATILLGLFLLIGIFEFYHFFKNKEEEFPSKIIGIIGGVILYLSLVGLELEWVHFNLNLLLIPILFLPFLIIVFSHSRNPLRNLISTFFPWIYLVYPFYLMICIYNKGAVENHVWVFILGLFILVWTNDTFAYLSGRFFGKHKLFERISPKKTWEGAVGGLLFTIIAGIVFGYFTKTSISFWATSALIISPTSILGDLIESRLKRLFDVKDSGKIMPGHGGILDRFDAVIFASPFFYLFLLVFG